MSLENEVKVLKESNNELVQKVQYWKMTAAQRESENVELMKEITDLRLKLSRLKNVGNDEANKLDAAVQRSSEEVLSHLVQASNAVARTMDFVKTYMHKRQELESSLPRWSTISEEPSTKKIHKVRPMVAGRSVQQPFVLLERNLGARNQTTEEAEIQNHDVAERAIPMHMLLDVYIPLRRIDADGIPATGDSNDDEQNLDDSAENLGLEEGEDAVTEEFANGTAGEAFEDRGLQAVSEESEPETEQTPQRPQAEDPLEGPSWMLDRPGSKVKTRRNFEPDSTTGAEDADTAGVEHMINTIRRNSEVLGEAAGARLPVFVVSPGGASVFSPTVRRRRASPPPPATPREPHAPHARRSSIISGRVLKVLVPKMHLEGSPSPRTLLSPTLPLRERKRRAPDVDSPLKRAHLTRFDAPSPNGATDAHVIVMETNCSQPELGGAGTSSGQPGRERASARDSRSLGRDTPLAGQSARESRPVEQSARESRPVNQSARDTPLTSQSGRDSRPNGRDGRAVDQSARDTPLTSQSGRDSRPNGRDGRAVDQSARETPLTSQSGRDSRPNGRDGRAVDQSARETPLTSQSGRDSRLAGRSGRESHFLEQGGRDSRSVEQGGRDSQSAGRSARDSDSEGEMLADRRPRRQKKAVVYKEKPLNRKMRR